MVLDFSDRTLTASGCTSSDLLFVSIWLIFSSMVMDKDFVGSMVMDKDFVGSMISVNFMDSWFHYGLVYRYAV